MPRFQTPNVPFVEARMMGPKQKPTAIVLDLSFTTSDKGAALGIARHLHSRNAPSTSFHYVVDEAEIYRGVWDDRSAYDCPHRAINILVCAQPQEHVDAWDEAIPVLHRTASLVADLILAYKIKARYLDEASKQKWLKRRWRHRGGLIVRIPGTWPRTKFLDAVHDQIRIKSK